MNSGTDVTFIAYLWCYTKVVHCKMVNLVYSASNTRTSDDVNSFQHAKVDETLRHNTSLVVNNVSYKSYCPLLQVCSCGSNQQTPVGVIVSCSQHLVVPCVIEHTHQQFCWHQNGVIVAKGYPPPDTCKATIGWDQMGGREIVGCKLYS